MRRPTTEKHRDAKEATTIINANNWFGNFSTSCVFFRNLSISGARAAAPATRNGLVTLFPVHISTTIWRHNIRMRPHCARACTHNIIPLPQSSPKDKLRRNNYPGKPSQTRTTYLLLCKRGKYHLHNKDQRVFCPQMTVWPEVRSQIDVNARKIERLEENSLPRARPWGWQQDFVQCFFHTLEKLERRNWCTSLHQKGHTPAQLPDPVLQLVHAFLKHLSAPHHMFHKNLNFWSGYWQQFTTNVDLQVIMVSCNLHQSLYNLVKSSGWRE